MSRRQRFFLVISLVMFFILAVPLALLYAQGYAFDWQKKKIVVTGGLYFKSIPKKAIVYLNQKKKKKTPCFIKRLLPGEYQIRIEKEGYFPWFKKMTVHSYLVSEARNIFLVPKNWSEEKLIFLQKVPPDFSLKDFFVSPKKEETIKKTDIFNKLKSLEASFVLFKNKIYYLQPSTFLLYQIDLNNLSENQISLTPLPPDKYEIFVADENLIALLSKQGDFYLFSPSEKKFNLIARNIRGVEFSKDKRKIAYWNDYEIWVYYLEEILTQPFKKKNEKELITRLSYLVNAVIWYPETDYHLIYATNQGVSFTELDNRYPRNTIELAHRPVSQIVYQKKEKRLYLVSENKLLSLELKTK